MSRRYRKSVRAGKSFRAHQAASARKSGRRRQIEQQAQAPARVLQLPLDVEALVEMSRQTLSTIATEMGLLVAQRLLEDEVTQRCGERHERRPDRELNRFGHQGGYVTIAGQMASLRKPRMRYTDARGGTGGV